MQPGQSDTLKKRWANLENGFLQRNQGLKNKLIPLLNRSNAINQSETSPQSSSFSPLLASPLNPPSVPPSPQGNSNNPNNINRRRRLIKRINPSFKVKPFLLDAGAVSSLVKIPKSLLWALR